MLVFSCIFLLRILIFKGLTARHLYKSFGVKELMYCVYMQQCIFEIHVFPNFNSKYDEYRTVRSCNNILYISAGNIEESNFRI
jgi:predicted transport protein